MNLTALTAPVEVVRQGFLDSLACAPLFPPHTGRVLDIGSGAGFPAIPLAVTKPGIEFTLVEPSRKKVTFLRHIARRLELKGIRIRPGRAEMFLRDKDMLGAFDVALARAVAPLGDVGPAILPFLRPGGVFLAQVGSGERVKEAVDRLCHIGFEIAGEAPVPVWLGKPGRRILTLRRLSVW
jgi:16S rRNA (guanine527-N7)-methyltransferase